MILKPQVASRFHAAAQQLSGLTRHRALAAPLRSSDRRKLKQRVVETFSLQPEDGDVVVPEGLRSTKFSTHLGEPGVRIISALPSPCPLTQWTACISLTGGRSPVVHCRQGIRRVDTNRCATLSLALNFVTLIATLSVYTLWKQRNMLPFLSTPSQVIPILVGGADLMAPGGKLSVVLPARTLFTRDPSQSSNTPPRSRRISSLASRNTTRATSVRRLL